MFGGPLNEQRHISLQPPLVLCRVHRFCFPKCSCRPTSAGTHTHTSCPILPLLADPAEGFHVNYLLWFDDVITELVRAAGEVTSPVAAKVLLCPAASRLSCIT